MRLPPQPEMKVIRLPDALVSGFLDRFQACCVVGGDDASEGAHSVRGIVFADGVSTSVQGWQVLAVLGVGDERIALLSCS